jgi:two-component system, NtrC family, sensor kinase
MSARPIPSEVESLRRDLAEIRAELIEEHRMASLGRLLAAVIHDINTPLGSLASNNQVLLRSLELVRGALHDLQPASLNHARDILDTCLSLAAVDRIACDRISALVRGVRNYSRPGAAELRKVDLNERIRHVLELMHGEFRRRIVVETEFGTLPPVECYAQMLDQVFLNLLVNAGQAIEGEGRVRVRTRLEAGEVLISISDSGRGMTAEEKRNIFTHGFTTKPAGIGTGLGLWISREIVEDKHGGTIEFESEPGAGTTFHIRMPVGQTKA